MPLNGRLAAWIPPTRDQVVALMDACRALLAEVEALREDWIAGARLPDGTVPVAADREELERLDAVIGLATDAIADIAGEQ